MRKADSRDETSLNSTRRSQVTLLIGGSALVISVIIALIAWAILQSRAEAHRAASLTTANLSQTLADQFNSTVRSMDLGLLGLLDELARQSRDTRMDDQAIKEAIARQGVSSFSVQ